MKGLKVLLLSFGLLFAVGATVLAQEMPEVTQDEEVKAEDLGISEPKVLPDSPFYFLKNWGRGIGLFFAFNPVKKAELRLKIANEKLMETEKLTEQGKDPKLIEKTLNEFQNKIGEISEESGENLKQFSEKLIHQQILHQKILQKLETQVPPQVIEKIKENREKHLEKFAEVMQKVESKEKIGERLEKELEKIKGSQFKEFKNLEILKNLEEKVPEETKEAIQKAQENALKRLQGDLEKMRPEDQEKFGEYIEKISGDKEKQLEIMENLKAKIKEAPETPKVIELKEKLEEGKTKIFERIEEKLEKLGCPLWAPPAPGFCKEGRVIIEKDPGTGCPLPPRCVVPGEVEIPEKPEEPVVCITLWDPVCGKDGKTYSNSCFAKLAGVEIDYKGKCREKECQTDANCPQLRCAPGVRCIGVQSKCIEGKCQIRQVELPTQLPIELEEE